MLPPNLAKSLSSLRKIITDSEAIQRIVQKFGTLTPFIGMKKERTFFNRSIENLFQAGISIRQLSRLTGISKGILQDIKKGRAL